MEMVKTLNDIINNTKTIDKYLDDPDRKEFSINLIKKGICFIGIHKDDVFRFYPSRYVGYKDNTRHLHERNDEKDGRVTNPAISKILGQKPEPSKEMEDEYKKFCESLGFTAYKKGSFGIDRKYWIVEK